MKAIGVLGAVAILLAACKESSEPTNDGGEEQGGPETDQAADADLSPGVEPADEEEEARHPAKSGRKPSSTVRHAYGIPIPGKEGFVFNPWTNHPVDVRGIPPGALVVDPQDPAGMDHKFRVPKFSSKQPEGGTEAPVVQADLTYPEARRHPDHPQWVINPHSGEAIDIGDLPDGAAIADPADPSRIIRIAPAGESEPESGSPE